MNERKFEELIRNIQAMIKCPHCGSIYTRENISIVGNMGEAVLVQLSCSGCNMPVMATIITKNTGRSLNSKNYPRLESSDTSQESPITADEIIETHDFLETFDGDFEHLFGK